MCANLVDPAPTSAARSDGPVATGAAGVSSRHRPRRAARGRDRAATSAPGLSARHGPQRATRGRGLAVAPAPGLSAEHGPWRAARNRGPAAAAELQWTWVFGFNFQLDIQNTLVSITTSLGHTLWLHSVKIIIGIFVSYEMEFSKLIN